MDPKDIPDRLRQSGRTQAELARYLRLDPSSLTKTIKGARTLKADELLKINAFFGGEPEAGVESLSARRGAAPRRIPVYGYAHAGAPEAVAFNNSQIVDWIDPPPLWNGVGDLIAIRVLGDSMEPRLFTGELVVAQIGLPPARERDCVVELQDGGALVKTYRGQKDGKVLLEQWNPQQELKLEGASVRALHAVIWRR